MVFFGALSKNPGLSSSGRRAKPSTCQESILLFTIKPSKLNRTFGPLVSKQAAVASVVFVAVQTMLLDHLGSSNQCCCDGRIANVWQRLDENFLDFFQCEAVIEPGPHVDGEFMGLTHGDHDGHRNQAARAPVQTGTSPDIRKDVVDCVGGDRGTEGV